ncbi:hypothetical protein [Streptomyces sp. JNUCC 63]
MSFPVTVLGESAYAGDRKNLPVAHEQLASVHGGGRTVRERLTSTTTAAASNHAVRPPPPRNRS